MDHLARVHELVHDPLKMGIGAVKKDCERQLGNESVWEGRITTLILSLVQEDTMTIVQCAKSCCLKDEQEEGYLFAKMMTCGCAHE